MATGKITLDEGTTTNTATHTISEDAVTKHIPRSVLNNSSGTEIGTAGAPVRVDPTGSTTQPISASSLPLPTGAATSAKQDTQITAEQAIQTSVELIDDAIKTDDAAFTPGTTKVMLAGFEYDDSTPDSVDEGDAGAARMSANRNQYVQIRDNAGNERGLNIDANGELGISAIRSALPAGTNAIGKLAANSGVDIGDVDVTSCALPTGASTSAKQDTQITAEQAIQTSVELIDDAIKADDAAFTPATTKVLMAGFEYDDTTPDSVDEGDAGAARMSANRNQYVQIRDNAGNERGLNIDANGELGISAIRSALPSGTNAIGKLAANSGVDIGDVDVTSVIAGTGATNLGKAEDAAHSSGDTGVMDLGVRVDTPNATVAANGDYHYKATDMVGGIRTALYETDFAVLGTNHVKKYYTSAGAVTDGIVWSPAAGKRWYVTDIFINVSAAATVTLEDDLGAGDSAVWKAELAANSGWSHSFATPLFSGEDAADLLVTTSAGNVYITVTGYEI